jgi:hypothetical protein
MVAPSRLEAHRLTEAGDLGDERPVRQQCFGIVADDEPKEHPAACGGLAAIRVLFAEDHA